MELSSKFVPQFEVQQPRFSWILPNYSEREKHHQSAYNLTVFNSRDTLQPLYCRRKNLEVHCNNDEQRIRPSSFTKFENSKLPDPSFSRLQVAGHDNHNIRRRDFGRFVAREALIDEEYWAAAWLRAEAHWEPVSYMQHVDSYKRTFAEQEFYALKRRCSAWQEGNSSRCRCFVAVTKDDNSFRRIALSKVVGTLDLSIRRFLKGETYPGEVKRANSAVAYDANMYAYIANVCVTRLARRWGIATNMLYLAIDVVASAGMKQLYVHVNADNIPAQKLYQKIGFKIVEAASAPLAINQMILMSMDL